MEIETLTDDTDLDTEAAPLSGFNLATPDGRYSFLWRLSELGPEGLLAATGHVWASLAPPKGYRAVRMAKAAKVDGGGKVGLLNVLARFIADFEAETDPPPMPRLADYESEEAWHAAVTDHFEAGEAAMTAVIQRYDAILNGDAPKTKPRRGKIIKGPWLPPKTR